MKRRNIYYKKCVNVKSVGTASLLPNYLLEGGGLLAEGKKYLALLNLEFREQSIL